MWHEYDRCSGFWTSIQALKLHLGWSGISTSTCIWNTCGRLSCTPTLHQRSHRRQQRLRVLWTLQNNGIAGWYPVSFGSSCEHCWARVVWFAIQPDKRDCYFPEEFLGDSKHQITGADIHLWVSKRSKMCMCFFLLDFIILGETNWNKQRKESNKTSEKSDSAWFWFHRASGFVNTEVCSGFSASFPMGWYL